MAKDTYYFTHDYNTRNDSKETLGLPDTYYEGCLEDLQSTPDSDLRKAKITALTELIRESKKHRKTGRGISSRAMEREK